MRILFIFCALFLISNPANANQDIPVKRVVLSTGGLGYFEHGAQLTDNSDLSFPVRLNQVNDILKSLLVFDPAGGLQDVSLPGKQPLEQLFRDMPFSQGDLNNPVALLNSYQGAELTITADGKNHTGLLVRVKQRTYVIDEVQVKRHDLTLMTSQGLKTFIYEDLESIQWTDAAIQNEVQRALKAVRENGQSDRRRLTIDFADGAPRDVMLSYVVEAPLWKTSYRLVLPSEDASDGHMQGWAIVENLTGGDWNDVDLSLTSGNPVTLQQDLYPAYFTSRPFVPVDVFGRVMPRRDDGAMAADDNLQAFGDQYGGAVGRAKASRFAANEMADMAMAPMAEVMAAPMQANMQNLTARQNVAAASETTAQVEFKFPQKFTLESGKTMMVPFVDQKLPMQSVALYQPEQHADHPFLSVSVENKSNSTLPPGILTIYQQASDNAPMDFVGDAQMAFLPKGEKRMVSYALDQKTKIEREVKSERIVGTLRVENGVLQSAVRYINETVYTLKAPAEENRKVVIEHPRMNDYKLADDIEVTKTHYRIPVDLKAGETVTHKARLIRTAWESVHIQSMSSRDILALVSSNNEISADTRKTLEELAKIRRLASAIEQKMQDAERQKQEIYRSQDRLRENIKVLAGSSDLKDRYLSELNAQEDELEDLEETIAQLRQELRAKQAEMSEIIRNMKL